jgi:sodium/hydrogen antiporter
VGIGFPASLLIFGLVLLVVAALSGWLHGAVLSAASVSVAIGVVLAWTGVIQVRPDSQVLVAVVELALVLTLFADGLSVERELLRAEWQPPLRALVVALPLTLCFVAVPARLLFSHLHWTGAFLLAAVLSSTDPVVAATVISSRGVPPRVRHLLNLESGLNDGLAFPLVLFLVALASPGGHAGRTGLSVVAQVGSGALIGLVLALLAAWLLGRLPGGGMRPQYQGAFTLGLAFLAFGTAQTTFGNGTIAAFVAGAGLALSRYEIPESFTLFCESLSSVFQIATFVLFGALTFAIGLNVSFWRLTLFVILVFVLARPLAIVISFHKASLARPEKVFTAWFGPKGVASMLFALLILDSADPHRDTIFEIAAYTVVASIAAHGLTDTFGVRWIASRVGSGPKLPGDSEAGRRGPGSTTEPDGEPNHVAARRA